MRSLSFVLAFIVVLAGPSIAGSADGSLPGIGTFAYGGSPVAAEGTEVILIATR